MVIPFAGGASIVDVPNLVGLSGRCEQSGTDGRFVLGLRNNGTTDLHQAGFNVADSVIAPGETSEGATVAGDRVADDIPFSTTRREDTRLQPSL